MIKSIYICALLLSSLIAQNAAKSNASKFEIKNGKKVYHPMKQKPVAAFMQTQIVQSDVRVPVIKGFFVEYKKN